MNQASMQLSQATISPKAAYETIRLMQETIKQMDTLITDLRPSLICGNDCDRFKNGICDRFGKLPANYIGIVCADFSALPF